jgi:hypothetical protein
MEKRQGWGGSYENRVKRNRAQEDAATLKRGRACEISMYLALDEL